MPEAPHCRRAQALSAVPRSMPAHICSACLTVLQAAELVTRSATSRGMPPSGSSVPSMHSAPAPHLQPCILDHMADVGFADVGGLVANERLVGNVPDLCAHHQTSTSSAQVPSMAARPAQRGEGALALLQCVCMNAVMRINFVPRHLHGPESCRHRGRERRPGADAIKNRGARGCNGAHACVWGLRHGRLLT